MAPTNANISVPSPNYTLLGFYPLREKSIERSVCKGKMAWDTSLWQNMKQSINTSYNNVDPKMQPAKVLEISTTVTDCVI